MAIESTLFKTEDFGEIGLTTCPVDESGEENVGTTEHIALYNYADNTDKSWGLATKFYVLSGLNNHNTDQFAHNELFNTIFSNYSDTIVSGGQFKFNAINDLSGNAIYANGKITYQNGEKSGFLVTSTASGASFDALSSKVDYETSEIRQILGTKQFALIAGDNITIDSTTHVISAKDTIYVLPIASETQLGGTYLDSVLAADSYHPVAGAAIYSALQQKQNKLIAGNGISITDNGLMSVDFGTLASPTSEKPVRSQEIAAALSGKQDNLIFNESQFLSSNNEISLNYGTIEPLSDKLVKSEDIYQALSEKQNNLTFSNIYFAVDQNNNVTLIFGEIASGSASLVKASDIDEKVTELTSSVSKRAYEIETQNGLTDEVVNEKTKISIDYGVIASGDTKPIRGGDAFDELSKKQNNLTAGDSISIENNVISVMFDSSITSGGEHPVKGKSIYDALNNGPLSIVDGKLTIRIASDADAGLVIVDTALDSNSHNPVENKAITTALGLKQKKIIGTNGIALDDTSIKVDYGNIESGSTKPVSSGELYERFSKLQPLLKEGAGISLIKNANDTVTISVTSDLPVAKVNDPVAGMVYLSNQIEADSSKAIVASSLYQALTGKQDNLTFSDDFTKSQENVISLVYGDISDLNTKYAVKGNVIKQSLDSKQDKLTFSSEITCSTEGNISLNYSSTLTEGNTNVPSQTAILNKLEEYQKILQFSTTDFVTSDTVTGIDVGINFGTISSGENKAVKASDVQSELAKKQGLLYFNSPFSTSTTETGISVSMEFGSIAENVNLPVYASSVYTALTSKQDKLYTTDDSNITLSTNPSDGKLYISAKDSVYTLSAATEDVIGGVTYGSTIGNYSYTVPASSIYLALQQKQNTITCDTGILKSTDSKLSLDYGNIVSYTEADSGKPVRCGQAYSVLLSKQETLCAGPNISIYKNEEDDKWYISQTAYVLPTATESTSGGVYFASSKFESTGTYVIPAKTVYQCLNAAKNALYGTNGIKISDSTEQSTELPYYQPYKKKIEIDFGTIAEASTTKTVCAHDIATELAKKNGKLSFNSTDFIVSDQNNVSINYASEITSGESKPAKTSTVYNFITNNSGDYHFNEMIPDSGNNCEAIDCHVNTFTCSSYSIKTHSISFPDNKYPRLRDFSIIIRGGAGGTDTITFPSDVTYYSVDDSNPISNVFPSTSASTLKFDFSEIMSDVFIVHRQTLTEISSN